MRTGHNSAYFCCLLHLVTVRILFLNCRIKPACVVCVVWCLIIVNISETMNVLVQCILLLSTVNVSISVRTLHVFICLSSHQVLKSLLFLPLSYLPNIYTSKTVNKRLPSCLRLCPIHHFFVQKILTNSVKNTTVCDFVFPAGLP